MIVRFGLDFDGRQPTSAETSLGFVVAGPSLFLSILETQLGIIPAVAPGGTRIVQYRACLREMDSPKRFYHRSFEVDEIGVARALLQWRDTWYMAGWRGTFNGPVSQRLQDMAAVEAIACKAVSPSVGQRLSFILDALVRRKTQIEKVELIDAFNDYPYLWRQVLEKLNTQGLETDPKAIGAKAVSDLARLQQALVSDRTQSPKIGLIEDGSVLVMRAGSRANSARLMAEYLKKNKKWKSSVIVGAHGHIFDQAIESLDLPKCGFAPLSVWRPPLQILPLALALLWNPVDPEVLAQFLNLPIAPLPKRVRARLSPVVINYPGIGGHEWQRTIEGILASERDEHGADEKKLEALAKDIDYWLTPQRFDPEPGANTSAVAERCRRVADYLAIRLGTARDEATQLFLSSAHGQTSDFAAAVDQLDNQGKTVISRQQLERLLRFTTGVGSPLADHIAEVGHALSAENPAVFTNSVDEVIWWDLSMLDLPGPMPWSRLEAKELEAQGVCLSDLMAEPQRLAKTWARPIQSARQRIVFVLHSGDENHHPIWDQICSVCSGWQVVQIDDLLRSGQLVNGLKVGTKKAPKNQLPTLQRWWQLPESRFLGLRDKESYSSLDAFIKSPYQWVLAHKAKLYAGGLGAPVAGNQLKGNLVHRLIELFFNEHRDWQKMNNNHIRGWQEGILPRLLAEEGASLLMPGMVAEKEKFHQIALRALIALVENLKKARIADIRVEQFVIAPFIGGQLEGYIDLLLTTHKGKENVVDVKWSGLRYRSEDLKNNRAFQLAVYAFLRKNSAGLSFWPAQANFIIEDARILAHDNNSFSQAVVVASASGEGASDLWDRFEETWRWRRAQLDRGLVEVTVKDTEQTADSTPPENGMTIDEFNDQFNDYAVLTGWRADQ